MSATGTGRVGQVGFPWHREYREIREAIAQLCAGFGPEYWDEHERDSVFPEEFFRAFAEGGWLGATVPEQYDGSGLPLTAMAAILEEVAASGGALDACSALHIPMLVLPILLRSASEEQRQRFIPSIIAGETYTSFGVTEPNAGTDTTRIETFATRQDDGSYVISGQKVWNSGALRADRVILIARTSPRTEEKPARGMSLFMVDLRTPGITIRKIPKISRNAVASTEVFFDSVAVPVEDLIGTEGQGFYHLLAGLNGERLLVAAECLGMGRWAVQSATAYAKERVVFGRPIGKNQSVQHPIADSYMQLLGGVARRRGRAGGVRRRRHAGGAGDAGQRRQVPRLRGRLRRDRPRDAGVRRLRVRPRIPRRPSLDRVAPATDRAGVQPDGAQLHRRARPRAAS